MSFPSTRTYSTPAFAILVLSAIITFVSNLTGNLSGQTAVYVAAGLAALTALVAAIRKAPTNETRPWYLTTEFWVSILAAAIAVGTQYEGHIGGATLTKILVFLGAVNAVVHQWIQTGATVSLAPTVGVPAALSVAPPDQGDVKTPQG